VTFQQVSTGKESVLLYGQKLAPAEPPAAEPRLVFDEVGNFEPSYTSTSPCMCWRKSGCPARTDVSSTHEGRAQAPDRQRGGDEK